VPDGYVCTGFRCQLLAVGDSCHGRLCGGGCRWQVCALLCVHTFPAVTEVACVTNLGDGSVGTAGRVVTPNAL
jgi:hypothetical protein